MLMKDNKQRQIATYNFFLCNLFCRWKYLFAFNLGFYECFIKKGEGHTYRVRKIKREREFVCVCVWERERETTKRNWMYMSLVADGYSFCSNMNVAYNHRTITPARLSHIPCAPPPPHTQKWQTTEVLKVEASQKKLSTLIMSTFMKTRWWLLD